MGIDENYDSTITDVIETKTFKKHAAKIGLLATSIDSIKEGIMKDPTKGDVISSSGGARKIRFALEGNNKGKSGGLRIIYVNIFISKKAYLLDIYSKNNIENIPERDKKRLKEIINKLKNK